MLELASLGAKVLQIRSVEIAMKYGVPVHVRSSFSDAEGTWVAGEDESLEDVVVAGVAYDKSEARVHCVGVDDKPGVVAEIFGALAEKNISVDMIIQNVVARSAATATDVTFTVAKTRPRARQARSSTSVAKRVGAKGVRYDEDIVKVSIVGLGMRSHAGIAAKMFRILAAEGINIQAISTSEIKVCCSFRRSTPSSPCARSTTASTSVRGSSPPRRLEGGPFVARLADSMRSRTVLCLTKAALLGLAASGCEAAAVTPPPLFPAATLPSSEAGGEAAVPAPLAREIADGHARHLAALAPHGQWREDERFGARWCPSQDASVAVNGGSFVPFWTGGHCPTQIDPLVSTGRRFHRRIGVLPLTTGRSAFLHHVVPAPASAPSVAPAAPSWAAPAVAASAAPPAGPQQWLQIE